VTGSPKGRAEPDQCSNRDSIGTGGHVWQSVDGAVDLQHGTEENNREMLAHVVKHMATKEDIATSDEK
jgi:hypothetical protein